MTVKAIVLAIVLGLAPGASALAQAPAPAAARILAPELRQMSEALGMRRGAGTASDPTTYDMVNRVQYVAQGRMYDASAKAPRTATTVSKMVLGLSYATPASRQDIERQAAGKPVERVISAMNGRYAWRESAPGVFAKDDGAGAAQDRRRALLMMTPHGFVRAAVNAAPQDVSIIREDGRPVIVLRAEGVTIRATLGPDNRPATIAGVVDHSTLGRVLVSTKFGDYKTSDSAYGFMFPGSIDLSIDGLPVFELEVTDFWAGPYLLFPVPAQVAAAPGK